MDLSPAQFHEHLNAFRERLGLEFHPNMIEFAGKRYPTVHQHITLSGIPPNPLGRSLRAAIAPEHGRIHHVEAYLPETGHHSGRWPAEAYDRLSLDEGGDDYPLYMPRAPHPSPHRPGLRDPNRFNKDVADIMREGALEKSTPHELLLGMNKESLREWAPATGKISIEHQVYPRIQDSRWYHFHVGSGALEQVEPPEAVRRFYERER